MLRSRPRSPTIAGVQMEPEARRGRPPTARRSSTGSHEAAGSGAKLVVFPECALTGYGFESQAEALPHAEPIPGPTVRLVAGACRAAGRPRRLRPARTRRRPPLQRLRPGRTGGTGRVVPQGPPALPRRGPLRRPRRPALRRPRRGRAAKSACTSVMTPASPRSVASLTLLGADLLVLPTNWPTHAECAAEHMIASRAMENVVYVLAVNRVGEERGFRFIGRSSIHGTRGRAPGVGGRRRRPRSWSRRSTRPGRGRSGRSASPVGTRSTASPIAVPGSTGRSSGRTGGAEASAPSILPTCLYRTLPSRR